MKLDCDGIGGLDPTWFADCTLTDSGDRLRDGVGYAIEDLNPTPVLACVFFFDDWIKLVIHRVCNHHGQNGSGFEVCVVSTRDPSYGGHLEEEDNEV